MQRRGKGRPTLLMKSEPVKLRFLWGSRAGPNLQDGPGMGCMSCDHHTYRLAIAQHGGGWIRSSLNLVSNYCDAFTITNKTDGRVSLQSFSTILLIA